MGISDNAVEWIAREGYPALFAILGLGVVGAPAPDELVLTFAGSEISRGALSAAKTMAAAASGAVCGISVTYSLGSLAGGRLLGFTGRSGWIAPAKMEFVRRRFEKYGGCMLFFGFFIPGMRPLFALSAGGIGYGWGRFAACAYPAALLWSTVYLAIGYGIGEQWRTNGDAIHFHSRLAAVLAISALGLVIWVRSRRQDGARTGAGHVK